MTGNQEPPVIGFVGLGRMGAPMARRLAAAGYRVRGFDTSAEARTALAAELTVVDSLAELAEGAAVTILMLPSSPVVRAVLVEDGLLAALPANSLLVDMSSSEPMVTRELADLTEERGITLLDAPVSGGVRGAEQGELTVMAGGPADRVGEIRPLLDVLGQRVLHVGAVGAGHALKALNNLLSATHLLVSSEALLVGQAFGLDPQVMLDAINGSSGRSGSTEVKLPKFVVPGNFASGFGAGLMVKDMRIAVGLAEATGSPTPLGAAATELWRQAVTELPDDADHTEVIRWLQRRDTQAR
ncbi:3-hydroxyisobutyrate dehydrogenase [Tamaricihabitans halophyticus]|uniref:3-hydroxyisobutyrate dehydrogenase n=1 Tax=Tamaricihabitans halophyticus TaxID=1262583 RepID=A0A4R2R305_9PSEU|nr:NAD(P)-dependent oxidoreductase [Tamaricihabitans halophyticus]TCP56397.1 3-hydroxyisobutyrate dehydrogenase [Tamaricihabitans halophyticus]